jgi:glycosyltransferase involved in cell wall biosynthesis
MRTHPAAVGHHSVAYVGTYPPKECGIATFTMDCVNSTDLCGWRSFVIPVDSADGLNRYTDSKVLTTVDKDSLSDYTRVSSVLTNAGIEVLCIQHEYGIFGGQDGEFIIEMARASRIPVVVTLHTVLPQPSDSQRRIIKDLEKHVSAFIVMAKTAVDLLRSSYGVSPGKIHVIPHGAPVVPFRADKGTKAQFGLEGRRVLSTFGLIGPSKGIEDAIAAMPAIVDKAPDALYMILGQTHPSIKAREGERYREQLIDQVNTLGLADNVRFVDKYLSLQELLDYLLATDVYITPYYANPNQITSGTLAYAITAGKVIVSTPYLYAKELLAEERGFLYPFRDVAELSRLTAAVLTDNALFETTRRKAYAYGQAMTWPTVGLRYARLFTGLINAHWTRESAQQTLDILKLYDKEVGRDRMHQTVTA